MFATWEQAPWPLLTAPQRTGQGLQQIEEALPRRTDSQTAPYDYWMPNAKLTGAARDPCRATGYTTYFCFSTYISRGLSGGCISTTPNIAASADNSPRPDPIRSITG